MDNNGGTPEAQSGLDYLKGMLSHWEGRGMSRALNMKLVAVADGTATFEARPTADFYNPQQRMHGGYCATLIDSAMGCAVQTRLPSNVGYGTIEMKVNYVRKLTVEDGPLTCVGTVIHSGRTLFTTEARVVDAGGRLYAHGSGTFLVYPS